MSIRPFTLAITPEQLDDLDRRLRASRFPDTLAADSWDDGTSANFLARLLDYWRNQFDWRIHEQRINRLPQFMAEIDGEQIHFLHQRGIGPKAMPLIITHGWPGSFLEMERLLALLTDPAKYGGDASDAFDVVVPSLPGYGCSPAPTKAGFSSRQIAGLWAALMGELGYDRFGAQGGDIGAGVSMWLARNYGPNLIGAHLNYIPGSFRPPLGGAEDGVSEEEQDFLNRSSQFAATEGAYAALHGTKPQTLAFALADSPAGLAAWIVEKFHSWVDHSGDLEQVVPFDTLLSDIALYWFSGSIQATLRLYKENRLNPLVFQANERVETPLGVALFPKELPMPPRSWVERVFDVHRWEPMARGGHFAALEQPEILAEEIRAFFRPLRH
ncbi:putative hydrolase or acyltransferase of alpha/beta superfamily [Pseudomonas sp. GM78]|uniref:epoxide hydrolase family protein n=1 Tax=Pseudomonas sp. GM78 TaxID=1144337 RepID=UPI00026F5133|nr:epoxide hydrolase family protein [Pseudomonas sp. GM78]EJN34695.1 putative hydrolase or acyltransferase of alpha/beta superfamily [Pseudomonas sp. GM78]